MNKKITKEETLKRAKEFNLEYEVLKEIENGASYWEALKEWDLLNDNELN